MLEQNSSKQNIKYICMHYYHFQFVFRSESYNYGVTSYNETFLVQGDK